MRITVVGATGQIGSRVVRLLRDAGQDVVAASLSTGVDVLSGDGVAEAVAGAEVLVDVTNSPSFDDEPVLRFFSSAATTLVAAARHAGVGHYVALSIVGADGLPDSGYMRAKTVQEEIIRSSGLPFTIVRATQFHEFAEMIVGSLRVGDRILVPDAGIQPIAAADVAAKLVAVALAEPVNGIVDIGGPEKMSFAELAAAVLAAAGDRTEVVVDDSATYFGAAVDHHSLVTSDGTGERSETTFAEWLSAR